jgi:hypothetical protein
MAYNGLTKKAIKIARLIIPSKANVICCCISNKLGVDVVGCLETAFTDFLVLVVLVFFAMT